MSNPFKAVERFFGKLIHFAISKEGREKIAAAMDTAQSLLTPALNACAIIAAETPTRSDDEILALVQKYALGTVTGDMLRNNTILNAILKHAAMAELVRLTGTAAASGILDMAIQGAYEVYQQVHSDVKAANPS